MTDTLSHNQYRYKRWKKPRDELTKKILNDNLLEAIKKKINIELKIDDKDMTLSKMKFRSKIIDAILEHKQVGLPLCVKEFRDSMVKKILEFSQDLITSVALGIAIT